MTSGFPPPHPFPFPLCLVRFFILVNCAFYYQRVGVSDKKPQSCVPRIDKTLKKKKKNSESIGVKRQKSDKRKLTSFIVIDFRLFRRMNLGGPFSLFFAFSIIYFIHNVFAKNLHLKQAFNAFSPHLASYKILGV